MDTRRMLTLLRQGSVALFRSLPVRDNSGLMLIPELPANFSRRMASQRGGLAFGKRP